MKNKPCWRVQNGRVSLSASNVDEVIRGRVLKKNEAATQTLRLLYEQKKSIIKNLITFTADTADKKLYADKSDFAACYLFIPYQFNLLGQVLTAVRTHGAIEIDLDDGVKVNYAKFQGVEVAQEGKKALKVDLLAKI